MAEREKEKDQEESEALMSDRSYDSSDSEDSEEAGQKKLRTHEQQKISGKLWGVLQFRKLRQFPFSVFFIVGNEFCERFSYYGMRAVLVLFLHTQLGFGENSSTAIYHAFVMLCYFLPFLGAVISDSCCGKYLTILTLSMVYSLGNIIVSVSAIPFGRGIEIALAGLGLVVIALGTGGIKPCVSAFGGDQFKENQKDLLRRFFSLFYFSINAGSVFSTLLTPVLRSQVHCFGTDQCFALAFGVPAVLMISSILFFVAGTKFYIIKKPKPEAARLFLDFPMCILTAIYRRVKLGKVSDKKHVLEYASPKYSDTFIEDVRLVLRVLVMFLPLPIFWALFDQQGSRWTLQAVRMNGELGKFTIEPDQVQALNPILILVFIPIFETIIYPLFAKCHLLKKPLQRMVIGMLLAGSSFVVAGVIQLQVQAADSSLKSGEGKVVISNTLPELLQFQIDTDGPFQLSYGESYSYTTRELRNYTLHVDENDTSYVAFEFPVTSEHIYHMIVTRDQDETLHIGTNEYQEFAPDGSDASVQVISAVNGATFNFSLCSKSDCRNPAVEVPDLEFLVPSNINNISVGSYYYEVINTSLAGVAKNITSSSQITKLPTKLSGGAIYTLLLMQSMNTSDDTYEVRMVELHPPNSVSIFYQIPMYFLITAGEVMFSITGLEFAYSQAPVSMKAICQAAWLWTVAFGNLFVIIIAESSIFSNQAIEFFFFAACIVAVSMLFAVMSYFYKYVDLSKRGVLDGDLTGRPKDETSALILDKDSPEEEKRSYTSETKDLDLSHSESEF